MIFRLEKYSKMDQVPDEGIRCQAPSHRCLMNGCFEFHFYKTPISNASNLIFRTLPFYRNINQIISPMDIDYSLVMSITGPNNGKHIIINKINNKYFEVLINTLFFFVFSTQSFSR